MARTTYALIAAASFHDQVVEEQFVRSGEPLQIGNSPALAVPVPQGMPYVAQVVWTTPSRCAVRDGAGGQHVLEPGRDVIIDLGPVSLRLYLAEQFRIKRAQSWSIQASLAWFTVILGSTVLSMQAVWVDENHCGIVRGLLPGIADVAVPALWAVLPITGALILAASIASARSLRSAAPAFAAPVVALLLPILYSAGDFHWKSGDILLAEEFWYCIPDESGGEDGGGVFTAEYLARLLKEDFDGEERGALEDDIDRPDADREIAPKKIFLPAGNDGPITKMGGAEDEALEPVRTVVEEDLPIPDLKQEEELPLYAEDVGTPVPVPIPVEPTEADDGVADGMDVDDSDADEISPDPPAEEEEGWGIPDWYDERDAQLEELEIERMLRHAKHRIAIDPDDPAALSVLSYYQYLAEDFDEALKTYDRFIELYPDDAAGYNNKALVFKRRGDYKREEALYRVALGLEPGDVTAMNNLAVNLSHQGRHPEALAVMEQLETLDPDDPYADLHRAKVHAELGDDDAALDYLEKALQGMLKLDTLHHIEFRQDIRVDPSFEALRQTYRFRAILNEYYGSDSPLQE